MRWVKSVNTVTLNWKIITTQLMVVIMVNSTTNQAKYQINWFLTSMLNIDAGRMYDFLIFINNSFSTVNIIKYSLSLTGHWYPVIILVRVMIKLDEKLPIYLICHDMSDTVPLQLCYLIMVSSLRRPNLASGFVRYSESVGRCQRVWADCWVA